MADSGDLVNDLPELFVRIGEAAKVGHIAFTVPMFNDFLVRNSANTS